MLQFPRVLLFEACARYVCVGFVRRFKIKTQDFVVDNMTLTLDERFAMLSDDMGGDTHDRYPELCNLWLVTLCWQHMKAVGCEYELRLACLTIFGSFFFGTFWPVCHCLCTFWKYFLEV